MHIEGNQAAFDGAKLLTQGRDPGRKEGKRERMRHGKLNHILPRRRVPPQHGAGTLQRLQHLQRLVIQRDARRRQARRVAAAVYQVGAGPGLKGLNAARKSRLGDVAQLRRAAETARFSQRHKVFKPFGFHNQNYVVLRTRPFRG